MPQGTDKLNGVLSTPRHERDSNSRHILLTSAWKHLHDSIISPRGEGSLA